MPGVSTVDNLFLNNYPTTNLISWICGPNLRFRVSQCRKNLNMSKTSSLFQLSTTTTVPVVARVSEVSTLVRKSSRQCLKEIKQLSLNHNAKIKHGRVT